MLRPIKQHQALLDEIEQAQAVSPWIWWLGHAGFLMKYYDIVFYLDPLLSHSAARLMSSPLAPHLLSHADLILCSHSHPHHLDPETLRPMLTASRRAKVVLPKSAAETAHAAGIPYSRMTTTDSDLRVEFFKSGQYARVYAVPSAHPELCHSPAGGYPFLGYLIRCGDCTIYHAGDCMPYPGITERLRPYNVTVALLPISGPDSGNFTIEQAAQLAEDIGARWLVPMHYGTVKNADADPQRFIEHLLFHRPAQRFKVFECGEGWPVPPREPE
jgi:L-ascorbate metabolism protein UlaG (beta-lactamase superfamily)